jgi:hypothetical protein
MRTLVSSAALAAALLFLVPATGEEPEKPDPRSEDRKPPAVGDAPEDPTEPDPEFRPPRGPGGTRPGPSSLPAEPVLPRIVLRGFVEVDGRPPAALLEFEGGAATLVHAGERVILPQPPTGAPAGRRYEEVLVKELKEGGVRLVFVPDSREVLVR